MGWGRAAEPPRARRPPGPRDAWACTGLSPHAIIVRSIKIVHVLNQERGPARIELTPLRAAHGCNGFWLCMRSRSDVESGSVAIITCGKGERARSVKTEVRKWSAFGKLYTTTIVSALRTYDLR